MEKRWKKLVGAAVVGAAVVGAAPVVGVVCCVVVVSFDGELSSLPTTRNATTPMAMTARITMATMSPVFDPPPSAGAVDAGWFGFGAGCRSTPQLLQNLSVSVICAPQLEQNWFTTVPSRPSSVGSSVGARPESVVDCDGCSGKIG